MTGYIEGKTAINCSSSPVVVELSNNGGYMDVLYPSGIPLKRAMKENTNAVFIVDAGVHTDSTVRPGNILVPGSAVHDVRGKTIGRLRVFSTALLKSA